MSEQGEAPEEQEGVPPISERQHRFRRRLALGLAAVGATVLAIPVLGFLIWPVRRRAERVWKRVGRLDEFPVGETVKVRYLDPQQLPWAGLAGASAAYLRRESGEEFVAFGIYCTHTGCPVNWVEGANLFLCPCHAGAFSRTGAVVSGPPPRPLARYPVRVRDGWVEVMSEGVPVGEPGDSQACGAAAGGSARGA